MDSSLTTSRFSDAIDILSERIGKDKIDRHLLEYSQKYPNEDTIKGINTVLDVYENEKM